MDLDTKTSDAEELKRINIEIGKCREAISHATENNKEITFKLAVLLLKKSNVRYNAANYEEAVDLLVQLHRLDYEAKTVFELLYKISYLPNAENLKNNYCKSCDEFTRRNIRGDWPEYEDLPLVLFPITIKKFLIYDVKNSRFLEHDLLDQELQLYADMMKDDRRLLDDEYITDTILRLERERAAEKLFQAAEKLLKDIKINDDIVLDKIRRYHTLMPESEKYEWMMGFYYYRKEQYQAALKYAKAGWTKRKLSKRMVLLMADIHYALKLYDKAARYYLFAAMDEQISRFYESNDFSLPEKVQAKIVSCLQSAKDIDGNYQNVLDEMSLAIINERDFIGRKEFYEDENGEIAIRPTLDVGKIIDGGGADLHYFVGLYTEYSRTNTCALKMDSLLGQNKLVTAFRTTFELFNAKLKQKALFKKNPYPVLVPVMATEYDQDFKIQYKENAYDESFGKWELNYFRLTDRFMLSSKQDFAIGSAIPLIHGKGRKKLVLSLLIDALSYERIKANQLELMPNVKKFFGEGIIFTENFTPAEWTLASEACIQTGAFVGKTQKFHASCVSPIDDTYLTIAQCMRNKGYHCVNISGCLYLRMADTYRGYHTYIGDESLCGDDLAAKALKYIRALNETDLFMHLHIFDAHVHGQPMALEQKVSLDLEDLMNLTLKESKSVWSESTQTNLKHYDRKLKLVDDVLGTLFSYILKSYREDEFVVILHSDHGFSCVGEEKYLFKPGLANSAFMLRGDGVPKRGFVDDEITNTVDVYAAFGHLCNYEIASGLDCRLPKALSGEGRKYSISNSLYPGQTYKMCIRTLEHEFRLETETKATNDGRVNMNRISYQLLHRDAAHNPIQDPALVNSFLKVAHAHTKRMHDPDL